MIFDVAPISLILGGVFKDFVIFTSKIEEIDSHILMLQLRWHQPLSNRVKEHLDALQAFYDQHNLSRPYGVGNEASKAASLVESWVEINPNQPNQNQPKHLHINAVFAVSIFCASHVCFLCRRVISVSRLDRETSGVLVAATCQEGADALTEQFKEHRVFKRYLALCTGRVEPPEGKGGWSVFIDFCGWILILWNWFVF